MNLRSFFLLLVICVCTTAANAQTPSESDLLALRFYVGENNAQAIQSEIRRLQLQYPDWTPPDDLSNLERGVPAETIDQIYRQIRDMDFAAARTTIDQTVQTFPEWLPSEELLETLSVAEAQMRFSEAAATDDAATAIRIARATPALLRCERINNAWLLADQYQKVDQSKSALAVYRNILKSCPGIDILVATLEKSASVATNDELADLAEVARTQAPQATERLTILETRLRAGLAISPAAVVTEEAGETVLDEMKQADAATASQRPKRRPEISTAETSPASAPASATMAPAEKATPGTQARGNFGPAKQAADRGDWSGCLAILANAQTAATLSQRGWCALNSDRTLQAINDFRQATSLASDVGLRRDSNYGMALAMLRANMVDQAAKVAANTHFDAAQRLEIESQILDKRGVFAFQNKDYRRSIAYFDELQRLTGGMRRDLALLRGYAYLNSGQRAAAIREFQRLHNQMATTESRKALTTALGGN